MNEGTYFPIVVSYDGFHGPYLVDHPDNIKYGVAFRVLKCLGNLAQD